MPLAKAGHAVTLLLEDSPDNLEKVRLECPNASVIWHKRGDWFAPERAAKQRAIRKLQPDIVWICGVGLRNWITPVGHQATLLADHSELYSAVMPRAHERMAFRLLERFYLHAFHGHVCASKYLLDYYSKKLAPRGLANRVHHSPYAYHQSALNIPQRRKPEGKKSILYLGSFWENYGFWDMLHAIKSILTKRSDIQTTFIGRGPEAEKGRAWVKEQGLGNHIHFPGYVDDRDLGNYLSNADVFLSPMRDTVQDWARCPSKQYLYLPFQRPVVTARIGESIAVFGDAGCYYDAKDSSSMANAILRALDHPEDYPTPDPTLHTFDARTHSFLDWYTSTFPLDQRNEL